MRYFPLSKDPGFYIEVINPWDYYQTCHDLKKTVKRRKKNICGTETCATFYHPEKEKSQPKGKKPKKEKGNKKMVRQKDFDEPPQKIIQYWNDILGTKTINPVKIQHLRWSIWPKTRLEKTYLPYDIRPTYIEILKGQPPPNPFALIPINIAEVMEIINEEKNAEKLAKKLAKEEKAKQAALKAAAGPGQ